MTDMTSDEWQELADLSSCCWAELACVENEEEAARIQSATRNASCSIPATPILSRYTLAKRRRFSAVGTHTEAQLREDIAAMTRAGEGHVDIDAIIRRVRELHKPQARLEGRLDSRHQQCAACRWNWPCATARLVYTTQELGVRDD